MNCYDCGEKVFAWHEYCPKCSGELFGRGSISATVEHSFLNRFFPKSRMNEE